MSVSSRSSLQDCLPALYEKMKSVCPGMADLELDEFHYACEGVHLADGWEAVKPDSMLEIERKVNNINFYEAVQLKPRIGGRIVMDENILNLTRMLCVGLVTEAYPPDWIKKHFYFDIRGFYFLHRTAYFTPEIEAHLAYKPWRKFESRRDLFDHVQSVGYKLFQQANAEVDECFLSTIQKLAALKGLPVIIAIAGQTAAGKTEIVERLREAFERTGRKVIGIEMDNFLTDRDFREEHGIDSRGKEALHYELFKQSLMDIYHGKAISIPRYDFVRATSSHDMQGNLRPGCTPIYVPAADVIFMEGNFPFLLPEIASMISLKVVYLTDDEIRLKRKWKRDMEYRKKYELMYFLNRYFREQYIMAEEVYRPQMKTCDMLVDTTNAEIWLTTDLQKVLGDGLSNH